MHEQEEQQHNPVLPNYAEERAGQGPLGFKKSLSEESKTLSSEDVYQRGNFQTPTPMKGIEAMDGDDPI